MNFKFYIIQTISVHGYQPLIQLQLPIKETWACKEIKLIFFNFRYLDLPNKDGMKPGSLPDLTNCYVSANPGGGGGDNQCEDQGSPYSSVSKSTLFQSHFI